MAEDYDAPRRHRGADDVETDSLEELQIRRHSATSTSVIDVDDDFALPDAAVDDGITLSEDEMTMPVVPMQVTEFRCSRCFLVHQIRRRAYNRNGEPVCTDCA